MPELLQSLIVGVGLMAIAVSPASAQQPRSAISKPEPMARQIAVDHMTLECDRSFEDVRAALDKLLPQLDPAIPELLRKGDRNGIDRAREHGPKLWLFVARDQGSLL